MVFLIDLEGEQNPLVRKFRNYHKKRTTNLVLYFTDIEDVDKSLFNKVVNKVISKSMVEYNNQSFQATN